jgi:hypothetical protein
MPLTPLTATLQFQALNHPTLAEAQPFQSLTGAAKQNIGYTQRYWTYVKGTRSSNPNWPESWYIHQDGKRVKDTTYNLFVMNPNSAGWQNQLAKDCPHDCFMDGVGTSSLTRSHLRWTKQEWITAVAKMIDHVVATGDNVLPNSIGKDVPLAKPILAAAGRGSTEAFNANTKDILRAGKVWVTERDDCGPKLATYLLYRGRGDHFSCYNLGTHPWDIPRTSQGAPLGKALDKAHKVRSGIRRNYTNGRVVVHPDGSYTIVSK